MTRSVLFVIACLVVLAMTLLFWLAGVAFAQTMCSPKADLIAALAKKYGEAPVMTGTIGEMGAMQFLAGDKGTWTVLAINTQGLTCVVAAGDNLEKAAPIPAGNPS